MLPDFVASQLQAFDEGTIERLRRLSFAVIGASGTGSPIVEQLMRLGAGVIVIVDDDHMEGRNVNRILNSTMRDVRDKRLKVDVLGDAVERTGLGTRSDPPARRISGTPRSSATSRNATSCSAAWTRLTGAIC